MTDRVLDVTDPVALRALAHPVRLRLLRLIREHGPVTGAQLAGRLGESTASVSYHLSVLARHGFVEPDPTPGPTRRHKPWRTTYDRLRMSSEGSGSVPLDSPGGTALATLLADARAEQDAFLSGALAAVGAEEIADAAVFNLSHLVLTAAEAERLAAEVAEVVGRYRSEGRPAAGEGRFAVSFVVVPVVPEEPLS